MIHSARESKCGLGRNAKEKLESHTIKCRNENGSNSGNYFNSKLKHTAVHSQHKHNNKQITDGMSQKQKDNSPNK